MPTLSSAAKHHKDASFSLLQPPADLAQNSPYRAHLNQTTGAKHPENCRNPLTHLRFRFGSNSRSEPKRIEQKMFVAPFSN